MLNSDQAIVFYPTYGSWDVERRVWKFRIHGKVYEPEDNSIKRRVFMAGLRSSLKMKIRDDQLYESRVRQFLVDNERGKTITITFAGHHLNAGTSGPNGHFQAEHDIDPLSLGSLGYAVPQSVTRFQAVLSDGDVRSFSGRVHFLAATGLSVISDIDDTIKDSCVNDISQLLRNTFMRDFKAVEGMSEVYRDLAKSGVAFHYVSGSPWQLYQPLESFFAKAGFPEGTMHLKHFRLTDSSVMDLLGSQAESKLTAIRPLMEACLERKFILVGDSGEQDPEIYGDLARQYPGQVIAVYIRNVTGAAKNDPRFVDAFRGVADDRWTLFTSPPDIVADAKDYLS